MATASHPLTRALEKAHPVVFSTYAIAAAFTCYFCMYAFRKPFAAGTFDGSAEVPLAGAIDLKILFIVAQVLGYCLSKFAGIKVISEMTPGRRALAILVVIAWAEGALALFGLLPRPYNAIAMFLNGVPLGMVWGLVFGFLEGRRVSEALGAGLSASYIVASGAVKTVGRFVMDDFGVSEYWMPAVVGLMFAPLMILCVWLLSRLPPPSADDEKVRVKREPMDGRARAGFVRLFAPGLGLLTLLYIFLTAYRDFRDNFAVEIWSALGYSETPSIMTTSELPIAAGVLIVLATLMGIRSNRKALVVVHGVMLGGSVLIGISTLAWQLGFLPPAAWMILVGLGLYIGYVPYGCVLFDRMIAALGVVGTAGFMIYVTDSFGYLGSVGLLLYKNFGAPNLSWLDFFVGFSYVTSILCSVCFVGAMIYFARKSREAPRQAD
ncbi:MAG: hypothetical protein KC620_13920 [Myxococcales bacterium]|nr:hypothetical protein [Myxococcales bacterium]